MTSAISWETAIMMFQKLARGFENYFYCGKFEGKQDYFKKCHPFNLYGSLSTWAQDKLENKSGFSNKVPHVWPQF